jgi:hypothetical protein
MIDVTPTPPPSTTLPPSTTPPGTTTNPGSTPVTRTDTFSQIGGMVGALAGGGAASFKFSATFSSSLKSTISTVKATEGGFGNKFKASMPGIKAIGLTELKAGGVGAIVSGAVSAITNGIDVLQGNKTGSEAIGTFAADTANGTIGAFAGVTAGGLATLGLSSLLGATPLLIVGVGVGALAAVVSDKLFKGSGIYDSIRNGVISTASQK